MTTPRHIPATPNAVRHNQAILLALAAATLTTVLYGLLAWRQWENLLAPSWDLGIFSQLAKAYSTFSPPIVSIKGDGFNLLGDHFHPILIVLGPIWALWPSPLALLLTQAVAFGISAYPLTRLAVERYGPSTGSILGLAYGLSWGLQAAAYAQFHEIAFAVPFLAFGLTAYLRNKITTATIWIGLLVFVKEDLGITVAVFGALMALRPRHTKQARLLGFGLVAWGLAWFLLATFVILPAFNPDGAYGYTGSIGSLLEVFVPVQKWLTVGMLALTAGLVGLRSPLIFLMLPTLAWRFTGNVEYYWGWQWHYSAVLMPIAFAALLEAFPALRWQRWLAVSAVVLGTGVLAAQLPLLWLTHPDAWQPSPRLPAAQEAIAHVTPGASVETELTLMARLVPHAEVFWLGNENPPPDFVILDMESYVFDEVRPSSAAAWAERQHPGTTFQVIFSGGDFEVAERVG